MSTEIKSVEITGIAYGGEGIAKLDDLVYFVADALPAQTVTLKNIHKKKNYARAEIAQVIAKASYEKEPGCEYFGECGGCQWLHAPYSEQLKWKENFIRDAIIRISRQPCPETLTLTPSAKDSHYRQRIRMKALVDQQGQMTLGFFKKMTNWVLDIRTCYIAANGINALLRESRNWRFSGKFHCSFEFQLCTPNSDELAVTCYLTDKVSETFRNEIKRQVLNVSEVKYFRFSIEAPKQYYVYDEQFGIEYLTAPGLFQQVNHSANRLVRQRIRELLKTVSYDSLLDLFCGSGNLSLGLGNEKCRVYGIEYSSDAISAAIKSVALNKLTNHTYRAGDAAKLLAQVIARREQYDLVLCDPPRAGMPACVPLLIELAPKNIFYLSCDPNTMARDIKRLCRNDYELVGVEGFDFFPNTFHIETLTHLRRKI